MAMTPDFEETLRKIDEDLDFNPATVDAAPTPLKKIVSFEKPPAGIANPLQRLLRWRSPMEKPI